MAHPFQIVFEKRILRLLQRLEQALVIEYVPFNSSVALSSRELSFPERKSLNYRAVNEGEMWGEPGRVGWFHLRGKIPVDWVGSTVVAKLDVGGEGLVWSSDGRALQGITDHSVFDSAFYRDVVPLFDPCDGGEEIELWIEAGTSGFFGVTSEPNPPPGLPAKGEPITGIVNALRLGRYDREAEEFGLDLRALYGLYRGLPPESDRRESLLEALNGAANLYAGQRDRIKSARERLATVLSKTQSSSSPVAVAVGHAHLDTAWLWTYGESKRKIHRTFATQVDLIDRHPEYIFCASQPQHYAWLAERDPNLFARVADAIREQRWEPLGAMWVEADCNVPSGESLIRQILLGKNYIRDEFGIDVRLLWLPDVFGYPATLPQIMLRSGITSFLTQKLSWNQVNPFPYTTFRWKGIDGSEVLTHFPPEHNYCSTLDADAMIRAERNFAERDILDEFIVPFGAGDGGGGPRADSIQLAKRLENLDGVPRVRFGAAQAFFDKLETLRASLPEWSGELYLEMHRGTLTSQALVKKMNRLLEALFSEIETLFSMLPLNNYPRTELDAMWKRLLLHQFHDVLPGSSIGAVYDEVHADHEKLYAEAEALVHRAASVLMASEVNAVSFFNPSGFEFAGVVELPGNQDVAELNLINVALPVQQTPIGTLTHLTIPAHGFATITMKRGGSRKSGDSSIPNPLVLENDLVLYEFDKRGRMISGTDLASGRKLLADGHDGNLLTLYEDLPNEWDAWDIDLFYRDSVIENLNAERWERVQSGPLRNTLAFHYVFGQSTLTQEIILDLGSRLLTFETMVDWHENHKMLRVAFPTNIDTDKAACGIQYGYIERSTGRNTSVEQAMFEVAAHKYVDLSDGQFGVALVDDGKYGHNIQDNILDLNLLRSPTYPDPHCDRGKHQFRYGFFPHEGSARNSEVVAVAECFNNPPRRFEGAAPKQPLPFIHVSGEGVYLAVVKAAEKEECLIARLVEYRGTGSVARLVFDRPGRIALTNLMEWDTGKIHDVDREMDIKLGPFEIRTYKIWMDDVDQTA